MKKVLLTALVAFAGAVALVFVLVDKKVDDDGMNRIGGDSAATSLELRWPAGRTLTYGFAWKHRQQMSEGAPIAADVDMAGTLEVTGLGYDEEKGTWRASARFPRLDHATYRVLTDDLAASSEGWDVKRAYLTYAKDGELLSVEREASAVDDEAFAYAVKGLLTAATARTSAGGAEKTLLGTARVRYVNEERSRQRVVEGYDAINGVSLEGAKVEASGEGTLRFRNEGYLSAIQSEEKVTVEKAGKVVFHAESELSMQLQGVREMPTLEIPMNLVEVGPSKGPIKSETDRKLRRSQAGDLTPEGLLAGLDGAFATGEKPASRVWPAEAAAVLHLNPELSEDIAARAVRSSATQGGRELALDLLSQVGHPEAQTALRTVLTDDAVRATEAYPRLVHRLTFVSAPAQETVALAETLRHDDDANTRLAATYAYGSLVGALSRNGNTDEAARRADDLESELSHSGDVGETVALIGALGNAKLADRYVLLRKYAADKEGKVRRESAIALRGDVSEDTTSLLIGMLTDDDIGVQRAAAGSLAKRKLAPEQMQAVAEAIQSGGVKRANDPLAVNLVEARLAGGARTAALEYLLQRSDDDPRLRARIRKILGR